MTGYRIQPTLWLVFLLLSPAPLGIFAWLSLDAAEHSLQQAQISKLSAIADAKLSQVTEHLSTVAHSAEALSRSQLSIEAIHTLPEKLKKLGIRHPRYLALEAPLRSQLGHLIESIGCHDGMIIDATGNILLSVQHEADFGENIFESPLLRSLGDAHTEAMQTLQMTTATTDGYAPSANAVAIFAVAPIVVPGRGVMGTLVLQSNADRLAPIRTASADMGATGEVFVVQRYGDELHYLSDLRYWPAEQGRLKFLMSNAARPSRLAARGETGEGIETSYSGDRVLAAWRYIPELGWGFVAQQHVDEAFAAARTLRRYNIAGVVLLLLVSFGLAYVAGRSFVSPLRDLWRASTRMAEGALDVYVEPRGSIEHRHLADSFNDMARRLAASTSELEQQVRTRTRELESAKNAAEAAHEAKSAFLAGMTHELRTPLNAILGFAQLSANAPDISADLRDNIGHITQAGNHMLAMVNNLLDLSRIGTAETNMAQDTVDLVAITRECLVMIHPIAEAQQVGLIVKSPLRDPQHDAGADASTGGATVLSVRADRMRLIQVLLNLLGNAVKYNRHGGSVTLDCEHVGERVRLRVTDTGMGIPKEVQSRVFQAFDRLGREGYDIEGTGIGLHYSKRVIEAMGGAIDFRSTEGEGSTFWIELPLGAEQTPVAEQSSFRT